MRTSLCWTRWGLLFVGLMFFLSHESAGGFGRGHTPTHIVIVKWESGAWWHIPAWEWGGCHAVCEFASFTWSLVSAFRCALHWRVASWAGKRPYSSRSSKSRMYVLVSQTLRFKDMIRALLDLFNSPARGSEISLRDKVLTFPLSDLVWGYRLLCKSTRMTCREDWMKYLMRYDANVAHICGKHPIWDLINWSKNQNIFQVYLVQ